VQVIFSVRSPDDVIFAEEWRDYPVTLVAEHNATHGFVPGRLSRELLQSVPDIANRTVMTCGPAPYMDIRRRSESARRDPLLQRAVLHAGGGSGNQRDSVHQTAACADLLWPRGHDAAGGAGKQQRAGGGGLPCRACGCKTKVVSGEYTVTSTMTLSDAEIAEGYVLACSCHPQGDLVLA
jgi:NADH oxidoreductase Hcr